MKKNVTYHIDEKLVEMVNNHKESTGIPKSTIVEFALKRYLKNEEISNVKQTD